MTRPLDGYPAHRRDRGRGPQRVLHVMTARRLHLARVKEEASFEQILDRYGVKTRGAGSKRMALCPFHPDTRPSCSIHLERNVFYCFGCGAKGSVLDFVARIENVSIHEAAERIEEMCRIRHDGPATQRREANAKRPRRRSPTRPLRPLPFRLTLDPSHPYLAGRNISPELAATFGLGYCSRGTMQGRICIPIHDERGVLVAYTGRWASDELPEGVPKYDLPRQFPKRRVLFNLHRVTGAEHLVLVEGYWSVFRLHALGVSAVSLMGRTLSVEQETLLIESGVRMLTLMLDGDRPGREATDELAAAACRTASSCARSACRTERSRTRSPSSSFSKFFAIAADRSGTPSRRTQARHPSIQRCAARSFYQSGLELLRIRQRRMGRRWRSAEEIDMHTKATIASATKDIPLNKLKPSPANVRKTGADVGLEEFAASIAAHGLLQPLVVEPERNGEGEETGWYLVTAGERRRKALRILAKQKRIKRNEPIPCLIKADGIASEISLAENVIRTSMHPADQFEAFQKLIDEGGLGIEEIAARFSVTPARGEAAPQARGREPRAHGALPRGRAHARPAHGLHAH